MKKFSNFNDAFNWVKKSVETGVANALPVITEQVYVDSEEYTFIDTHKMYESGKIYSKFQKGFVILKAPQVKRLYYIPVNAGPGNRKAVTQWFEITKTENMDKYKKQLINSINKSVKGG